MVVYSVKDDHDYTVIAETPEIPVAGGRVDPKFSGELLFGDPRVFADDPDYLFLSCERMMYISRSVSDIPLPPAK